MFPAMMILGNLARRMWRPAAQAHVPEHGAESPRFDFSDARDAYEQHATATDDMRAARSVFRKRR
jgi:hypothetical protein